MASPLYSGYSGPWLSGLQL